jgi:hypothetical protein
VAQVIAFVAAAVPVGPAAVDPRRGGGRVIAQFVGTCALDALPRWGPVFSSVVESISLTGAGLREDAADVVD